LIEEGNHSFTPLGLPDDTSLPFFAYGIFKKGEIAWPRLQTSVSDSKQCRLIGHALKIRNGLAVAVVGKDLGIMGTAHFPLGENLYSIVGESEPKSQYKWQEAQIPEIGKANFLLGRYPDRDTSLEYSGDWSSMNDPAFRFGLPFVRHGIETAISEMTAIEVVGDDPNQWRAYFSMQSVYLLMWTIFERYLRFAYGEHDSIRSRYKKLETSTAFRRSIEQIDITDLTVYDTRSPQRRPNSTLNSGRSSEWMTEVLDSWYLIRSNIAHRGKDTFEKQKLPPAARELLGVLQLFLPRVIHGLDEQWNFDTAQII